jgi:hypothetical protein
VIENGYSSSFASAVRRFARNTVGGDLERGLPQLSRT